MSLTNAIVNFLMLQLCCVFPILFLLWAIKMSSEKVPGATLGDERQDDIFLVDMFGD